MDLWSTSNIYLLLIVQIQEICKTSSLFASSCLLVFELVLIKEKEIVLLLLFRIPIAWERGRIWFGILLLLLLCGRFLFPMSGQVL